MKTKTLTLVLALAFGASLSTTASAAEKMFEVQSGIVEYEGSSQTSMLGATISATSKSTFYFKDYGRTSWRKTVETSKNPLTGTESSTSIMKIENGIVYMVNEDEKVIYKQAYKPEDQEKYRQLGKELAQEFKTEERGTDQILGYTCKVHVIPDSDYNACLYKGVTLKSSFSMMGSDKNTEIATSAKFDVNIDADQFKLPDYPIKDISAMAEMAGNMPDMETMQNMSEEELNAFLKKMQQSLQ